MSSNDSRIYAALWRMGELSGCHQRADRSFFLHGRQFPVCARCTGAAIGQLTGMLVFPFWRMPVYLCVILCGLMFADWLLQRLGILESTNLRRFLTGIGCGGALIQVHIQLIMLIASIIL